MSLLLPWCCCRGVAVVVLVLLQVLLPSCALGVAMGCSWLQSQVGLRVAAADWSCPIKILSPCLTIGEDKGGRRQEARRSK